MLTAKKLEKVREMLATTTSNDSSILKRAGTSLVELCEYIEKLEHLKQAIELHQDRYGTLWVEVNEALAALDADEKEEDA